MALYKDGNVYRTYEEQVEHLTDAHRKQLIVNNNVSKSLQDLTVAANLGGYNLVRFAFQKQGQFYKMSNNVISVANSGDIGDYVEISSNNANDIPAYGYFTAKKEITLSFLGDFSDNYTEIIVHNVTKNTFETINVSLVPFDGSSLLDYDPMQHKKQLFNVLTDLAYGTRAQYVSFDLNNDDVYNYVFIGVNGVGKDGRSFFATNGTDFETVKNAMKENDLLLIAVDNTNIPILPNAKRGDVYIYNTDTSFTLKGSILGIKGDKGDKGDRGIQGIQGIPGIQGNQGEKGEKGDKGDPGDQGILIFTGVLGSPDELPEFSTTTVGDAYRVINTSGSIVTYDLYFHAKNGTDWDIQPNWGGVKGDKGDKGDKGNKGDQGIQGIQGEKGEKGDKGDKGDQGEQGIQGIQGPAGPQGGTVGYVENYKTSKSNKPSFNAPNNYLCILFADKNIKLISKNSSGDIIVFHGANSREIFKSFTPVYIVRRNTSLTVLEFGDAGSTKTIPTTEKISLIPAYSSNEVNVNIQFIPFNP